MDRMYIVGNGHSAPEIDPFILDKINSDSTHMQTDPALILLHTEKRNAPRNTASWLAQIPFSLHHHVRIDLTKDYQRLLRFIRDRAVGVVLSGGGTRGWAHIGAIRALREAKVPIDIIGGTSVGAIIAACYAMEESVEDAYEKFYRIIRASKNAVSWRNMTWPTISLFNAKGFTTAQMDVFGDTQIDDLWIPYFCISCNLSSNTEEAHHSGLLWEKTRASASVPGLIPPMILDGALHLDGGLLNNLPVDVMRQYVGKRGKVIAIELNNFSSDRHKYHFPPILTFKQTLFSRLGLGDHIYKFPRFVETFLRGLFVGSLAKSRQNSLGTNIMINLNLSKFRLLHSNPKQAERLIEIGYKETLHRLLELKDS
jgi:NTE family protein